MKFSHVAEVFNQIEATSSRLEMTEILAGLFKEATPAEAKIIAYLSLGTLRPPYITTQFNFAKKSAIQVVANVVHKTPDAVKVALKLTGDLGSVLADALAANEDKTGTENDSVQASLFPAPSTSVEMKSPTLTQVYRSLEDLEKTSGTGSQETKFALVTDLVAHIEPQSAKYVIRVLTGTLRLGFSDMTIIDALSWMLVGNKAERATIEHAYNLCANIGQIAFIAREEGIEGIKKIEITVGYPIRLAAAERAPTAQAIVDRLGPCVAEPKLDGFRLQIHVDNVTSPHSVKFFSRNLLDMSSMFPDLVAAFKKIPVKSLICEGEAIAYDPNTKRFLPFQETVKRKRKHGIEEAAADMPLQVYIFDLLYLDGESYLDKALTTRRAALTNLFKDIDSPEIKLIEEIPIKTGKELEDYFHEQVGDGLEGVVVKKPNSHYQPGKRNFNWIKLKRQDTGSLDDTIDCVILGYYHGSGKRASFGIGAFLVGVYNKKNDRFESVAKVGTGLSDAEWKELRKKCDPIQVAEQPKNVECAKSLAPDVWVDPRLICLVRADEITRSPAHMAGRTADELGYALRFPRIMGYRPDKSAAEATTVTELKRLFEIQQCR